MLKVQEWLQKNDNNFEVLKEEYGIKFNLYEDRVVLNYSQIECDKFDSIAQECRALILHFPDTSKIMSRAFDRFFNYNEDPLSESFDVSKATIYEKADGSLISVYSDEKDLCISTRSMAFAEGETVHGPSYRDLVFRAKPKLFQNIKKYFSEEYIQNITFIFELCTPENRVVKQYNSDKLFLLGIRHKHTGTYVHDWDVDSIADQLGVDRPEELCFNKISTIMKHLGTLPVMDEGYVCNWDNWRIKIKNPAYLAIAHLRENGVISPKRICKLLFLEDVQEYLSYFPEDYKFFLPYMKAYIDFRENLNYIWLCNKDVEDQKEFAMQVKDTEISGFLFGFKRGYKYEDMIAKTSDNRKLELLTYYMEE